MSDRDRAYADWKKGMKPKAIAEKYDISINTVKSWISRHWKKKEGAPDAPEKVHPPRKPGAPVGNKNAVGNPGGGAPRGNKNSFKHGLYETIYWDSLDDEERAMIANMRMDKEEALLEEQIQLLTVRERRLMRRIKEQSDKQGGIALDSVTKRQLEVAGNVVTGRKQTQTETTTRTISTFEVIQKLESELTRVQGRKTRCIEALNRLRIERQKVERDVDMSIDMGVTIIHDIPGDDSV